MDFFFSQKRKSPRSGVIGLESTHFVEGGATGYPQFRGNEYHSGLFPPSLPLRDYKKLTLPYSGPLVLIITSSGPWSSSQQNS